MHRLTLYHRKHVHLSAPLSAERQAKLFRALLARAPLNEAERERVIEHGEVYVPILVKR